MPFPSENPSQPVQYLVGLMARRTDDGSWDALTVDAAGLLQTNATGGGGTSQVVGNVASGVADAGNPVKVGGVYHAVLPTPADGNRVDLQVDSRGVLLVNNAYKLDSTNDSVSAVSKPATSGGYSLYSTLSVGTSQDAAVVKGSAGQLYGYLFTNTAATPRYAKLYDKATTPASTDTPKRRIMIPGNTAGAGLHRSIPAGVPFASGIGIRITTGAADNDVGGAGANEVIAELEYF